MTESSPSYSPERAFVIAKHPKHGFLVLYAYKDKKGGEHGQLPGGRVDRGEHRQIAAVRELLEETGMIISTDRLRPLKHIADGYFFFALDLMDSDQVKGGDVCSSGEDFKLKMSEEHTRFQFFKDWKSASAAVVRHSKGIPSRAIEVYAESQV